MTNNELDKYNHIYALRKMGMHDTHNIIYPEHKNTTDKKIIYEILQHDVSKAIQMTKSITTYRGNTR